MAAEPLCDDLETDRFSVVEARLYTNCGALWKPIGTMRLVTGEDARIATLAAEQFHEHGITATGVDALSRAAGISKRTLYQRFGSKDGLIAAAYAELDLPVFQMFTADRRGSGRRAASAARGLLRPARAARALAAVPRAARSRNAATELADPNHPAHKVVRRHKERIRRWLLSRAKAAGASEPGTALAPVDARLCRRPVAGAARALGPAGPRRVRPRPRPDRRRDSLSFRGWRSLTPRR